MEHAGVEAVNLIEKLLCFAKRRRNDAVTELAMPQPPEESQRVLGQNANLFSRPRKERFIFAVMRDHAGFPFPQIANLPVDMLHVGLEEVRAITGDNWFGHWCVD